MLIAIASNDGISVNCHFGKARTFHIFRQSGKDLDQVESRSVEQYSKGSKVHDFDTEGFMKIHSALSDCNHIICTKIGKKPEEEFNKRGIEVTVFEGPISNAPL